MKKFLASLAALAVMSAIPALAADTIKGRISDSMCNAKHADGEHGTKKMTDKQCVDACKEHGAKYVLVGDDDKIYQIANQNFAGLKTHSGHDVTITGTTKDDTVTITKIEMPAKTK